MAYYNKMYGHDDRYDMRPSLHFKITPMYCDLLTLRLDLSVCRLSCKAYHCVAAYEANTFIRSSVKAVN